MKQTVYYRFKYSKTISKKINQYHGTRECSTQDSTE